MFRGRSDRLSNAAENEDLTIGFRIMEWIQEKREQSETTNIGSFKKYFCCSGKLRKLAGDPGWCRGFFCSCFVLRWDKLHHVCVLMELSSKEREIDGAGEKAGGLLQWCPWQTGGD